MNSHNHNNRSDHDCDCPTYLKVATAIRDRIDTGDWTAGTQLPSETQLMSTHKASRVTIRLAVDHLRRRSLVETRPGLGTFVRDNTTPAPTRVPCTLHT